MPAVHSADLEYVGFWPRVGAALIDTLLILVVTVPLVTAVATVVAGGSASVE